MSEQLDLNELARLATALIPAARDEDYLDDDGMHCIIAGFEWFYGSPESCEKLTPLLNALPRLIEELQALRHLAEIAASGTADQLDDALTDVKKYLK